MKRSHDVLGLQNSIVIAMMLAVAGVTIAIIKTKTSRFDKPTIILNQQRDDIDPVLEQDLNTTLEEWREKIMTPQGWELMTKTDGEHKHIVHTFETNGVWIAVSAYLDENKKKIELMAYGNVSYDKLVHDGKVENLGLREITIKLAGKRK